jgi:Tol biopolymer transport system component
VSLTAPIEATEQLLEHTGKQLVSISGVSRDGRTLLINSNAKGGYQNVAVLDLTTKKLRWLTDTQWSAAPEAFTPDGESAVYTLNADGRVSTRLSTLRQCGSLIAACPQG